MAQLAKALHSVSERLMVRNPEGVVLTLTHKSFILYGNTTTDINWLDEANLSVKRQKI